MKFGLAADSKTDEADKRMNELPIRQIRFIRYHASAANSYQLEL
jgi:hypothetical protein